MGGEVGLILVLTAFLQVGAQTVPDGFCPASCQTGSCCNNYLMDNPRREVIDFNTTVRPGSYGGVAVKLCGQDPFALDLWQEVEQGIYRFSFNLDYPGTNNGWKKIQREGEPWWAFNFTAPLNLSRTHFLGVMGMTDKIPIPYSKNAPRDGTIPDLPLHQSLALGNIQGPRRLLDVTTATIEEIPWSRTFKPFVHFCASGGCADETFCVGCRGPPGRPGTPGPPGPPGPPGTTLTFGCDSPDNPINEKLNEVGGKTDELLKEVTKLGDGLNRIGGGDRATGVCPARFQTGPYGLGNCYLFENRRKTFGEAAIDCIETADSHLVDITSLEEDVFLANTVQTTLQNTETNRTYWTSGIFSRTMREWVWYDEKRYTTTTLQYQNWATNQERGFQRRRNCLVLQVFSDKTFRWISSDCTGTHNYICKKTKNCF